MPELVFSLVSFVWILGVIAFWFAVVYIAIQLGKKSRANSPRRSSAVEVLEERYARGEISRDEFEERRAVLRGDLTSSHI